MTDNRYYRYLKLPFNFVPTEPKFIDTRHVRYDLQPHSEFTAWLDSLNLEAGFSEAFRKSPGDPVYPWSTHLDGSEFDDHVKINFVHGHGTSKMIWVKLKEGYQYDIKTTMVGTEYLWAPLENCDIVAEDQILQPTLVNAGQLHNVIDVSEVRTCYSFMLRYKNTRRRLLWDDAIVLFKDYLE